MAELADYADREQAWVKHWMLRKYLERLVLKVGTRWKRFVYIDGFAGPWGERTEDLSDTSFGTAIDVMHSCQTSLAERGKSIPMRAAFFEKDWRRAAKLRQYAKEHSTAALSIDAYHADFMDHIDKIAAELRDDDFTFVFLDPKGYKEMVPNRLAPVLRKRGVEVLINVMWDFMNRFWSTEQAPVLDEIFGRDRRERCSELNLERDANRLYAERLRDAAGAHGGRLYAATFPVQHPTKARTHYFLVYTTHASIGLLTFDDVAKATWREQALTKAKTVVRRQSAGADLFGCNVHDVKYERKIDASELREAWLGLMPVVGAEIVVTYDVMAELLERCGCLTSDLQAAALQLIQQGVLVNRSIDESAQRRRTKNAVALKESETLRRLR
ncbi:hypothetical protein B5P43_02600 [Bacillus sp. SRB_336]|nr:hypothetical protein B5P43_02600 [Bacillus sp. SRB_336]